MGDEFPVYDDIEDEEMVAEVEPPPVTPRDSRGEA